MSRTTTLVVVASAFGVLPALGQQMPDTVSKVLTLHQVIERYGSAIGPRIWPGFRPDTIPTLYVIAHRGKLLIQWRHDWPTGFTPVSGRTDAGFAGSQVVSLPSGRFISFMSIDSNSTLGGAVGTSIHEAFHSYERSVRQQGRRFGDGENAMLVGNYPVFDVENEAGFALEGTTLKAALTAPTAPEARRLVLDFLAMREARQSRLAPELVEFEQMAEINEGLAQYALIKGLRELGDLAGGEWPARARIEADAEIALLDSMLVLSRRSVRRRFYATGSTIALLLDRLGDSSWKSGMVAANRTPQGMLGQVAGFSGLASMGPEWRSGYDRKLQAIRPSAEQAVARLKAARQRQADSVVSAAPMRLVIDYSKLGAGAVQWCGFDPQNTLQTGDGRTIHMRFLKACGGGAMTAEFERPVVQYENGKFESGLDSLGLKDSAGTAIVLPEGSPVSVGGLKLNGLDIMLEAASATLCRERDVVTVTIRSILKRQP